MVCLLFWPYFGWKPWVGLLSRAVCDGFCSQETEPWWGSTPGRVRGLGKDCTAPARSFPLPCLLLLPSALLPGAAEVPLHGGDTGQQDSSRLVWGCVLSLWSVMSKGKPPPTNSSLCSSKPSSLGSGNASAPPHHHHVLLATPQSLNTQGNSQLQE